MAENNTAMLSNFLPINKKVKTNKILLIKKKKDAVSIHTHTHTHTHTQRNIMQPHKRNEIMQSIATLMSLEIFILSGVSQTEEDQICSDITCEIRNMTPMNLTMKQNLTPRQKTVLRLLWGTGWREASAGSLGFLDANCYTQDG